MKYKDVLKKIKPFLSPITNKSYIAIVDDNIIKEDQEIDVNFWLANLALMKSYELKKQKQFKIKEGKYMININIKEISNE